jgi:NADP-dependent 3-hydroxy acid dehydrogenase YdfG
MPCIRSFQLQEKKTIKLENKVVLVTGATSGIGEATEAQLQEARVDCLFV